MVLLPLLKESFGIQWKLLAKAPVDYATLPEQSLRTTTKTLHPQQHLIISNSLPPISDLKPQFPKSQWARGLRQLSLRRRRSSQRKSSPALVCVFTVALHPMITTSTSSLLKLLSAVILTFLQPLQLRTNLMHKIASLNTNKTCFNTNSTTKHNSAKALKPAVSKKPMM